LFWTVRIEAPAWVAGRKILPGIGQVSGQDFLRSRSGTFPGICIAGFFISSSSSSSSPFNRLDSPAWIFKLLCVMDYSVLHPGADDPTGDAIMDSGYYAACAGLAAQTQALELVANNLANLGTAGYRGQFATFRSLVAGGGTVAWNPLNAAVNDFGVLSGSRVDLASGSLVSTGNPLDLAVAGTGFFAASSTPAMAGFMRLPPGNWSLRMATRCWAHKVPSFCPVEPSRSARMEPCRSTAR
jgi:hypothetical protein